MARPYVHKRLIVNARPGPALSPPDWQPLAQWGLPGDLNEQEATKATGAAPATPVPGPWPFGPAYPEASPVVPQRPRRQPEAHASLSQHVAQQGGRPPWFQHPGPILVPAAPSTATRPRSSRPWLAPSLVGLVSVSLIVLLLFVGYVFRLEQSLPGIQQALPAALNQTSIAYTADGKELSRFYNEDRTWVTLDALAPSIVDALLAIEDRRFYDHDGVDYWRLLGSMWYSLWGDRQGGSTITMQLVRNQYPDIRSAPLAERKIKEVLMAQQLEQVFTKRTLLEWYLNAVPFGYNAYGIEAAAQTFFSSSAADLTPSQSALLIGMLKGTTRYNPRRYPERALARRNLVLQQMHATGRLTTPDYQAMRALALGLRFQRPSLTDSPAPYFADYVRRWAEDWAEANGYDLYRDGLRVYTTLDTEFQVAAEDAAHTQLEGLQAVADYEWSRASERLLARSTPPYLRRSEASSQEAFRYFWEQEPGVLDEYVRRSQRFRDAVATGADPTTTLFALLRNAAFRDSLQRANSRVQASLIAIDPVTGHVKAWVGGRDYATDKFDKVAMARRQPGSTFKPFLYATALDQGYSPYSIVQDTLRSYYIRATGEYWQPRNAGGSSSGAFLTLKEGIARSKNTVAAHLINAVGPRAVARTAEKMGITSPMLPVPSLALGTSEVTLYELASGYATLANGGTYVDPVVVSRIENAQGEVLYRAAPERREALDATTAYTLIDMLRGVLKPGGTGAHLRTQFNVIGDLAGKTGTTQNNSDGWFMLMHPQLVVGAWVGFNDQRIAFRTDYWGQGGRTALPLVGDFMERITRVPSLIRPDVRFQPPLGYVAPRPVVPEQSDQPWYTGQPYDGRAGYILDGVFVPYETTPPPASGPSRAGSAP